MYWSMPRIRLYGISFATAALLAAGCGSDNASTEVVPNTSAEGEQAADTAGNRTDAVDEVAADSDKSEPRRTTGRATAT